MEIIKLSSTMWLLWKILENERLMGFRVFTRGIWYALLICSCFGLLISGKKVVFSNHIWCTIFYVVMLLICLFFADYPDSITPVLKSLGFVTSFIILSIMFFCSFKLPYHICFYYNIFVACRINLNLTTLSTIEIGHALLFLFLAFTNGGLTINFASQDYPLASGFLLIIFLPIHCLRL